MIKKMGGGKNIASPNLSMILQISCTTLISSSSLRARIVSLDISDARTHGQTATPCSSRCDAVHM